MNTLPPGFELESPALPAGFEFENVPQPPEGFQLEGVLVNDRPRLDEAGLQGNESPNAHAIGPFGWPLEVIEQGATKLGNFVLDPRYGILNKVLQGLGRTGFATERMEFGSPEYAQGQPTPIKPLFGAGQPIVTGQFADEDVDPVNRMTGNLLRGFTTPGSALTLGVGTALKAPKVMAIVFGGPMVDQAPETTAQMGAKVGEYVGTPPEQRTEQLGQETADAVLNEAVNKLMLGGLAQGAKFAWDNRPITPEVLPPLKEAPPFQPLDRRLGNNTYIDADVTGQKLLTEGQKQIGFPSMAEALAKVGESLPKQEAGDAASFNAGQKMNPVEGQSSSAKSKAPISEDGNSIASTLGLRFDGRQEMIPGQPKDVYTKLDSKNPYTVYVEPGASAEMVKVRMGEKESGSTIEQDQKPIDETGITLEQFNEGTHQGFARMTEQGPKIQFQPLMDYLTELVSDVDPVIFKRLLRDHGRDVNTTPKEIANSLATGILSKGQKSAKLEEGLFRLDPEIENISHRLRQDYMQRNEGWLQKQLAEEYNLTAEEIKEILTDYKQEGRARLYELDPGLGAIADFVKGFERKWTEFRESTPKTDTTKRGKASKQKPIEDRGSQGGNLSSFGFLDPAFWKQQLGIAHEAKADAVQIYNRIRNKLGEKSAGWEMLNTPEFKAYMQGVRTPSEVEKWINENGPYPIGDTTSVGPESELKIQLKGKEGEPITFSSPDGYKALVSRDPAPGVYDVERHSKRAPWRVTYFSPEGEVLGHADHSTWVNAVGTVGQEGPMSSVSGKEWKIVSNTSGLPQIDTGKDVAPPKVEMGLGHTKPQALEKASLQTQSFGGKSLKNLINIYLGRADVTGPARKSAEAMMLGKAKLEDLYPDELESIYGQLQLARKKLTEKGLSNEEVFNEIRARMFILGARAGKNVVKASRAEMEAERVRLLEKWNDKKLDDRYRTQAEKDATAIRFLLEEKPKGITIRPGSSESGAINMSVIKDVVALAGAPVKSAGQAVRWYSEPLVERLGRMGGPVSKMVSEAGGQIISRQKMYYGRITPLIDPAKKAMGRPNAANIWMRKLHKYNERAAVNNMFGQNEGTVPVNPAASRETALLNRANLAVGHLATLANPQFVPSNKLQRMLTSYGVDVVRRGAGPAWEAWTKGVADANGVTLASVQGFFRRWKAEMDEPTSDVAALNSINQDFTRFYPKSVTHIKPGMAWHEVIIADPFAYLEGSAQRTATAVAFREVFPAGSRMLQQTRKLVQAELKTDTQGTEFDNLIRALQGHPTDTFVSTITAPDTWAGGGMRMLSQVVGTPLKSLMLTGNAATNIGEVIVGGPAIFLGYRNALPAVLRLPYGYAQLELNGQVNRALQNYSYDPSSPLRSLTRAVSGGIRSITFQQALNELQEAHAAMSASVVTERILAHNFSPTEGENFVAAMRGMGMTEANARRALAGDRELLSQFERRAAASLTSGHVSMAERSRAGTSRAFNELFWFHSYPQMTLNQVRKVMENLAEDVQNGNTRQMAANSKLLGRLIAGRTMQGAITAGIYALVFGGLFGLAVKKKEAKDGLGKFLIDSYIGGLGGPAAIGKRLIEQGGDSKTLAANVAALSTPVSAASDLYDLSMGNGRYEGRRAFERVGMFIESKTPAAKMFQTGMALYGLSEGDPKLDVAMKAFYRWRREEKGWKTSTSEGDPDEDKAFRAQMRRVVEKLQAGGDWKKELESVVATDRAGKSLFARTLLRDQNGKGLSEADMGLLRKRIGDEAVNILQARDSMVRQIARELGASEGDLSKVNTKPLGLAVDAMSQGKRIERLQDQLGADVSEWLTKNKLHLTDISPSRKIAGRHSDLDVPEYTRLEEAAVQEYDSAIRRLMMSPTFESAPVREKQERLNKVLDLAEKRAKRMSR